MVLRAVKYPAEILEVYSGRYEAFHRYGSITSMEESINGRQNTNHLQNHYKGTYCGLQVRSAIQWWKDRRDGKGICRVDRKATRK